MQHLKFIAKIIFADSSKFFLFLLNYIIDSSTKRKKKETYQQIVVFFFFNLKNFVENMGIIKKQKYTIGTYNLFLIIFTSYKFVTFYYSFYFDISNLFQFHFPFSLKIINIIPCDFIKSFFF